MNVDYQRLVVSSLIGNDCCYTRKPVLATKPISENGMMIMPNKYASKMSEWKNGKIDNDDINEATIWRKEVKAYHITKTLKDIHEYGFTMRKYSTTSEIKPDILDFLDNKSAQEAILSVCISCFVAHSDDKKRIMQRWISLGRPILKQFAPYAHYYWTVITLYSIGANNSFFGLRRTDFCDMLYTLYLPFTTVFCSNDSFHKKFVPLLLFEDQEFITGDDLRSDVQESLSKLKQCNKPFISKSVMYSDIRPLYNPSSFTYKMWIKHNHQSLPLSEYLDYIRDTRVIFKQKTPTK